MPQLSQRSAFYSEEYEHPILAGARRTAATLNLSYAGGVRSPDAYMLFAAGVVVVVDVRTAEERMFVGHVPGSLHVPWQLNATFTVNPFFVRQLDAKVHKDMALLFLCRSGKRSAAAATAASRAGFSRAFNILEGFEGEFDGKQSHSSEHCLELPWIQA